MSTLKEQIKNDLTSKKAGLKNLKDRIKTKTKQKKGTDKS